jgi:hypothetical protein
MKPSRLIRLILGLYTGAVYDELVWIMRRAKIHMIGDYDGLALQSFNKFHNSI